MEVEVGNLDAVSTQEKPQGFNVSHSFEDGEWIALRSDDDSPRWSQFTAAKTIAAPAMNNFYATNSSLFHCEIMHINLQ